MAARINACILLAAFALAGCMVALPDGARPLAEAAATAVLPSGQVAAFRAVAARMEPQMEAECRARRRGGNCDFLIVVDERPGQPANAFQTLDRNGRPIIGFTRAMIADMGNADEFAFVLGHEAAHHIAGHIESKAESAMSGMLMAGALAAASGADPAEIQSAQKAGALIGARRYAKEFELAADALGAIITRNAGFDAVRGAAYFGRAPDPGNRFLGTHPPNAARLAAVRRALAASGGG